MTLILELKELSLNSRWWQASPRQDCHKRIPYRTFLFCIMCGPRTVSPRNLTTRSFHAVASPPTTPSILSDISESVAPHMIEFTTPIYNILTRLQRLELATSTTSDLLFFSINAMLVLPKSLQFMVNQWLPVFIQYGPSLTMFITVGALAALSYGLAQLYLAKNFTYSVNLTDVVSVWGITGKPGVSWFSTMLWNVHLIIGVCRLYC